MKTQNEMIEFKKAPLTGVLKISTRGNISAGVTAKRTGYRVHQEGGTTKVRKWHNEGYPQRRDLGEEVVMPKSFYDLATHVGMDDFSQDFLKIFMSALSRPGTFCLPAKSYFSGKLDQQVFTIDYDTKEIVPKTYRELFHLVAQSSRPAGSGTKYFATQTGSESQPWAVGYYTGSCEKLFQFFETEDEAVSAVEDMWIDDVWNKSDFSVYATHEEAQQALAETL
jgi:hypothetical protein